MASFPVVLDACVLYPIIYRDFLLFANLLGVRLYDPVWSDGILDEMGRNLIEDRKVDQGHVEALVSGMNRAYPDAISNPPADLIEAMTNHPKDRHVLATAVLAGAEVIVTENVDDFLEESLEPYGIEAQSLDKFLQHLLSLNAAAMASVAAYLLERYRKPPFTPEGLVQELAERTPGFAFGLAEALRISM